MQNLRNKAIIENLGLLLKAAIQATKSQFGNLPRLQLTEMKESKEDKNEETRDS